MNRRNFLSLIGGGIILAAGSATGGFIWSSFPRRATAPWQQAGSLYSEPRKKALSYAILAPNPHNRQPWKIKLVGTDKVEIYVDTDRLLPKTDIFSRQITIGFGCFLEVLRIAAAEDGYNVRETLFPNGFSPGHLDDRPVAYLTFEKQDKAMKDPLFHQILNRRSHKIPFDPERPVASDKLLLLKQSVKSQNICEATNEKVSVDYLKKLTRNALQLEIDTPRTYRESVDLFRIGKAEVEANPDGITFSGPKFELLSKMGQFSRELALNRNSSAYAQGIKAVLNNAETAMAHIWIITKTNTRRDQISAGRDWVRLNLSATEHGICLQPLSQALQEYDEMSSFYKDIHTFLAPNGGTVQMLGRLGYAENVEPAPRWALSEKIIGD